jgi:hypothetical protein
MTREDGVPPEVSGFRRRSRPEVRDRTVLTPEPVGKKSARVPSLFSWPNLPGGGTGNLRCTPRPPPNKVNLRRKGPLTAQPRAARGHPQGKGGTGVKSARRGGNRRIPSEKQMDGWLGGRGSQLSNQRPPCRYGHHRGVNPRRIFQMNIWAWVPSGGDFPARVFPGDKTL